MNGTRRWFLQSATTFGAAIAGAPNALGRKSRPIKSDDSRIGPLQPDPDGVIDLPKGFTYQVLSRVGETMDDGLLVPGLPDGMAAFPGADGKTRVVRNHELMPGNQSPFGENDELLSKIDESLLYDPGIGRACGGGTTTFVYDTRTAKLERQFMSLAGTLRNCAGGPTPWGSWVTCEEAPVRAGTYFTQDHGFAFEVPSAADGLVGPIPLADMGRFNREAIAIDEKSGAVYQTEDRPDSLLYRYLPTTRGDLAGGGTLQVLAIKDNPSVDTRNWHEYSDFPTGYPVDVDWIEIDDVLAPNDDLRSRGFLAGAARFARGEGMWSGDGVIWFACTSGGRKQCGQIFGYRPSPNEGTASEKDRPGQLELFLESEDPREIDFCDNLTVAPWGDLLLCEDGGGDNFLVGVTQDGKIYPFARNAIGSSEFAGATFSPDGSTLFVNVQAPGITLAIRGPWPNA